MLFIDCTEWCKEHNKTIEDVEKACWKVGVALQDGKMFHGPCHLRLNVALPHSKVKEAFRTFGQQQAPISEEMSHVINEQKYTKQL